MSEMAGDSLYRPSQGEEGFKGFKKKCSLAFPLLLLSVDPFPVLLDLGQI